VKRILLGLFILLFATSCTRQPVPEKRAVPEKKTVIKKEKKVVRKKTKPAGLIPKSVMRKAAKKYGYFARKRYEAYNKLLYKLQKSSTPEKLEAVNDFFNRVPYGDDIKVWGKKDYWATPLEFLGRDKGDCEDYVIAKYVTLLNLGIPSQTLFISYVKSSRLKEEHMVLSYFETPSSVPLILDNTNYKIFPADQRKDLTPVYNLNLGSIYLDLAGNAGQNRYQLTGKGKILNRWERLIKDVKRNKY